SFSCYGAPRDLHSFPARGSSDLAMWLYVVTVMCGCVNVWVCERVCVCVCVFCLCFESFGDSPNFSLCVCVCVCLCVFCHCLASVEDIPNFCLCVCVCGCERVWV